MTALGCSAVTQVLPDVAAPEDRAVTPTDMDATDAVAATIDVGPTDAGLFDGGLTAHTPMDADATDAGPCFGAPGYACASPGEVCPGPVFMCFGPPWNGRRAGVLRCTCVDASFECGDPCAP